MNIESKIKKGTDEVISKAARMLLQEGVPVEILIDRLLTAAIAQMVQTTGRKETVRFLRQAARTVDSGIFDFIEQGKTRPNIQ